MRSGPGPAVPRSSWGTLSECRQPRRSIRDRADTSSGKTVWKTDRSFDYATVPSISERHSHAALGSPQGQGGNLSVREGRPSTRTIRDGKGSGRSGFRLFRRPGPFMGTGSCSSSRLIIGLWAMRVDGSGDVTDSHVAWKRPAAFLRDRPVAGGRPAVRHQQSSILSCLEAKQGVRLEEST